MSLGTGAIKGWWEREPALQAWIVSLYWWWCRSLILTLVCDQPRSQGLGGDSLLWEDERPWERGWCVTYFTVSTNNNVILQFCLTNPRKNPTCSLYISACAHIALWSRVSLQMRRSVVAGEKDLSALQGKYYRLVKVKLSVLITHERLNTGRLPWQSAFRARCFCWSETCFRPNWLRSRRMRFFAVFARVAVSRGVK